jgi:DNA-binding MarR family transcriptional regulator
MDRVADVLKSAASADAPSAEWGWLRLMVLVGRCHRGLGHQFAAAVATEGASAAEMLLMAVAHESPGGCQQSDLVDQLGCSAAHVSGVMERLRQRGWLTADRLPADRRRQSWRVTESGATALGQLRSAWQTVAAQHGFDTLESELPQLLALLEQLDATLDTDVAAPTIPFASAQRSSA